MKFSYNWLQELSGTRKTPEELSEFLTLRAFEVEEMSHVGGVPDEVVIGRVTRAEKHPDADRLRVATVALGMQGERIIVCGASNLSEGQMVAVALPGTILPSGDEIASTVIRGVRSEGMICSERELGLGTDHEGILVLPEHSEEGSLLSSVFRSDWVFDVKILPDRAHDCLAHVGLAREIAALEGRKIDYDYDGLCLPKTDGGGFLSVSLGADGKSKRYIGAFVRNISIGASPRWVIDRLKVFGMKSINSVVDATNLVMLELGQPLHAFDWDKLTGDSVKSVGPRYAKSGEEMVLLNGRKCELGSEDIVIADENHAIALGGIMGGLESAVTPETKSILFEAAHFDPVSIRRTRIRLGIESDASYRFEKGISQDLPERAMVRLLEIVKHIAGGEVVEIVDRVQSGDASCEVPFEGKSIADLLGINVASREIERELKLRGFSVERVGDHFRAAPPAYRLDIVSFADIAEEIGKAIGYDRIPVIAPLSKISSPVLDPMRDFQSKIRDNFVSLGYTETYNYSFYSERDAQSSRLDVEKHFFLENPLNADQALVRRSLIPGLLRNVAFNLKRFSNVQLFECGKVTEISQGKPSESVHVGGVFVFSGAKDENGFYAVKGVLSAAFGATGLRLDFRPENMLDSMWHPTRTAKILFRDTEDRIGTIGEVSPFVAKSFGISVRIFCFEVDLQKALLPATARNLEFVPFRKYPETLRDLSFFVPDRVLISDVERIIRSSGEGLVSNVELFDRYQDPIRGKSLAFHVRLSKESATVTSEEADNVMVQISESLERELGGSVRRE